MYEDTKERGTRRESSDRQTPQDRQIPSRLMPVSTRKRSGEVAIYDGV